VRSLFLQEFIAVFNFMTPTAAAASTYSISQVIVTKPILKHATAVTEQSFKAHSLRREFDDITH